MFGNNFLTLKTTLNSFLSVNMFIESRSNSLIQPQAQLSKHIIFEQSIILLAIRFMRKNSIEIAKKYKWYFYIAF